MAADSRASDLDNTVRTLEESVRTLGTQIAAGKGEPSTLSDTIKLLPSVSAVVELREQLQAYEDTAVNLVAKGTGIQLELQSKLDAALADAARASTDAVKARTELEAARIELEESARARDERMSPGSQLSPDTTLATSPSTEPVGVGELKPPSAVWSLIGASVVSGAAGFFAQSVLLGSKVATSVGVSSVL